MLLFTSLFAPRHAAAADPAAPYGFGAADFLFNTNTTTTLYQDSAHTAPVSASNDPVGYISSDTA